MEVMGSLYTGTSEKFFRGLYPIARCVKAEMHDLGVVMVETRESKLGNIYSFEGGNYAGNVYDSEYVSPALKQCKEEIRSL